MSIVMKNQELENCLILMLHDMDEMRKALEHYEGAYVISQGRYWNQPELLRDAESVSMAFKTILHNLSEHKIFLSGLLANNPDLCKEKIEMIDFLNHVVSEASSKFSGSLTRAINTIEKQKDDNPAKSALALTGGKQGRDIYKTIGQQTRDSDVKE